MIHLNPLTVIDVVPFDARRNPVDFVRWQVVRADASAPWLPGDRFTLYRVGQTRTFRLEHAPVALNRLRAQFGRTGIPTMMLVRSVVAGDFVELAGSTLTLRAMPADAADDDGSLAGALR
jgi:hypothetical protein